MTTTMSRHLHAVLVEGDLVLLDVAADAYLCVPGASQAELEAALLQAGLAVEGGVSGNPAMELPTSALDARREAPIRARDVAALAGALLDYELRFAGRPFRSILDFAARGRPPLAVAASPELSRLTAVFERLVVWLPLSGRCLVRSFLLLRFLARCGVGARWVFGVGTWPFSAHCWLQVENLALDDAAERLVAYTPILVV